jgi:hypothetical protein
MNDSTRISDLPDASSTNDLGNTYIPMNMHSNPYGNTVQDLQPYPQQDKRQDSLQRLPSRDIAMQQNNYTNDEEIKANYIPQPSKNIKDYIKDYQEDESERIRNHNKEKNHKKDANEMIFHFQEAFMIGVLFFISQMWIVSSTMRKYCNNLGIYDVDGNLNVNGMIFKSILFSSLYTFTFQAGHRLFPLI